MRLGPVSTSAEVAHREWLVTGSVNYPTDSTIWGEAHSGNQWHWEIRDYGKSGTTQIGIADFLWTPPIPRDRRQRRGDPRGEPPH